MDMRYTTCTRSSRTTRSIVKGFDAKGPKQLGGCEDKMLASTVVKPAFPLVQGFRRGLANQRLATPCLLHSQHREVVQAAQAVEMSREIKF